MKKTIILLALTLIATGSFISCNRSATSSSKEILLAKLTRDEPQFVANMDVIASALVVFFEEEVRIYSVDIVYEDGNYYLRGKAENIDTQEKVGKVIIDLILQDDGLYVPSLPMARVCTLGNSCLKCIDNGVQCACETSTVPQGGSCYWADGSVASAYERFLELISQQ